MVTVTIIARKIDCGVRGGGGGWAGREFWSRQIRRYSSDMSFVVAVLLAADALSLMSAGDKALAARDFRDALFAYQALPREDPGSATVWVKLGEPYARMGHDLEAVESFSRALRLEPRNARAQQGIGASRERMAALAPPKPAADAARIASYAPSQRETAPSQPEMAPPKPAVDEAGARERYTVAVRMINERHYNEALTA